MRFIVRNSTTDHLLNPLYADARLLTGICSNQAERCLFKLRGLIMQAITGSIFDVVYLTTVFTGDFLHLNWEGVDA